MENKEKILEVKDLRVSFNTYAGEVRAVRGVDFDLPKPSCGCCNRLSPPSKRAPRSSSAAKMCCKWIKSGCAITGATM